MPLVLVAAVGVALPHKPQPGTNKGTASFFIRMLFETLVEKI
jgi:hypothetical protein